MALRIGYLMICIVLAHAVAAQSGYSIAVDDSLQEQFTWQPPEGTKAGLASIDLDTIAFNEKREVTFHITNHTDSAMTFYRIGWGEPTFAPTQGRMIIEPGDTAPITYRCVRCNVSSPRMQRTARWKHNQGLTFIRFRSSIRAPE